MGLFRMLKNILRHDSSPPSATVLNFCTYVMQIIMQFLMQIRIFYDVEI